jgi:2-C-methyl-D-erythritol 4-phosphate cytidylyltransferase
MSKFAVILPAAGKSQRFSKQRKKPFVDLKKRAVWLRAVDHFVNRDDVAQVILVLSSEDIEDFKIRFQANLAFMNITIVEGGQERVDSVYNGLKAVRGDVEYVAVHDAARPLLTKAWVDKVFQAAQKSGAAILGIPQTSTLKKVNADGMIEQTVSREKLWQAQTPQVFRADILREAYAKRGHLTATDEAQLVEQIGQSITMVEGSPINLKITTQEDFRMAEALLEVLPKESKLNFMHPFADDNPQYL